MTGTETAAGAPECPGERRETRDRPPCLPAVGALVHRGAADQDHALFGRGVAAGEDPDRGRRDPGLGLRPLRGVLLHVCRQLGEARGVARDEDRIMEPLANDDVHERERQGGVGARPDQMGLVGLLERLAPPHIDGDDPRAATLGCDQVRRRGGLTGEVGAPEDNEVRVGCHVLLGVDLHRSRERHAEAAQVRKARGQPSADRVDDDAVTCPDRHRFRPYLDDRRRDAIECLVPGGVAPRVVRAHVAQTRTKDAHRVVDDLPGGLATNAEEAAAVGILVITADAENAIVLDLDLHPAVRRMAVHRAHGADATDLVAGRQVATGHRALHQRVVAIHETT